MKGMSWDISSLEQLETAAKEILAELKSGPGNECAGVLALSGDLGAGKTTFTQTLARLLGVTDNLTSPTFVIMKKYPIDGDNCFRQLVHIDAYRLASSEELRVLGFTADLLDSGNLVVVEWAEKVATLLPVNAYKLHFTLDGSRRTLRVE